MSAMNSNVVVVYTKPQCSPCMATKFWLQRKEVPHEIHDITESAEAEAKCKEVAQALGGVTQMPIVVIEDEHGNRIDAWSDFRLEKLRRLVVSTGV